MNDFNERFGRLDALINCVGTSDRGLIENLSARAAGGSATAERAHSPALLPSAIPTVGIESGGAIVNIGSLASKVGARYIGGYAIAKHALAGMTQQLRLELKPRGIHVGTGQSRVRSVETMRASDTTRRSTRVPESRLRAGGRHPFEGAGARASRRRRRALYRNRIARYRSARIFEDSDCNWACVPAPWRLVAIKIHVCRKRTRCLFFPSHHVVEFMTKD